MQTFALTPGKLMEVDEHDPRFTAIPESPLKKLLDQARLLLQIVAIRTAPENLAELMIGSNFRTRNAAYLHPDALRKLGLDPTPGVRVIKPCGKDVLIVCTPLLPPFGVIYGPLFDLFLHPKTQRPEDFEKDWNVAVLYPEIWEAATTTRRLYLSPEELNTLHE